VGAPPGHPRRGLRHGRRLGPSDARPRPHARGR
jgi:hypothetical protein